MRAGNIIGGESFAIDRIISDCFRAALQEKEIIISDWMKQIASLQGNWLICSVIPLGRSIPETSQYGILTGKWIRRYCVYVSDGNIKAVMESQIDEFVKDKGNE